MGTDAIQVKYKDAEGNSGSSKINYINGSASRADLIILGQKLMGLTSNTYQSTNRIVTTNLDTDDDSGEQ